MKTLPLDIISEVSSEMNVPFSLLAAIVWQESGGNAYACRFEVGYKYTFKLDEYAKELKQSKITEEVHQKTSWGLCQLMGGVLRELGFNDYLPKALDPRTNLTYCCKQIKRIMARNITSKEDIFAAYNAGSPIKGIDGKYVNQAYVDSAMNFLARLQNLDKI